MLEILIRFFARGKENSQRALQLLNFTGLFFETPFERVITDQEELLRLSPIHFYGICGVILCHFIQFCLFKSKLFIEVGYVLLSQKEYLC